MVIKMYFDSLILNLLLILFTVITLSIINYLLNRHAKFLMKYTSSLKMNSKDLIIKYSKDNNIILNSFPSKASNDLDSYFDNNKSIFINARHYYSSSLYTLARTLYFCAMSKVAKEKKKEYNFQSKIDSIFTMSDVLAWGLVMVGILLKMNVLIIIGLMLMALSFLFAFINMKIIILYQESAKDYLRKISKEKNEIHVVNVVYRFELYQYLLRPLLSIVKLFPFLMSINQKKLNIKEEYYEE